MDLVPDIIGIVTIRNDELSFEPNYGYEYFSEFGFMKLTPEICALLYTQPM